MGLHDAMRERVRRVEALLDHHARWMERGDDLIRRVSGVVFYPGRAGHGVVVLRWRRCARGDGCVWCSSFPHGAHGPYWFVTRRWAGGKTTSAYISGKLTRTAMRKVMGHTRGYEALEPLVREREEVVSAIKEVRAALRKIDNVLSSVEALAARLGGRGERSGDRRV